MSRALIMAALLIAGCASVEPADYTEVCNQTATASLNRPPPGGWSDPEGTFARMHRSCVHYQIARATAMNRERGAMAAAIVLGAGSDALATHNFYTYRVPEARRNLERNR